MMMMNPDDLDALLRNSDPANAPEFTEGDDPILQESTARWTQLSRRRTFVRRCISLSVAAIALFALVGGSAFWAARVGPGVDRPIAEKAPTELDDAHDAPLLAGATSDISPQVIQDDVSIDIPHESGDHSIPPSLADKPRTRPIRKRNPERDTRVVKELDIAEQRAEFVSFIEGAGEQDSPSWHEAREYLATRSAATQSAAIRLVPQLDEPELRTKAFQLVSEAAGDSERMVLTHWLAEPSTRSLAWNRLVTDATITQSVELLPYAINDSERTVLCRKIAGSPDPRSAEVLLGLAGDPVWRSSVGLSASALNPRHIQSLILLMRRRNVPLRTASAFVLASVPGDDVDRVVASMILSGRFRQPAYLVLLSRNTPQARAFLAQAASRPDLTPALVSARLHFANIQPRLQQWIAESKGANHERSDTSQRFFPETLGDQRCVCLDINGRRVG